MIPPPVSVGVVGAGISALTFATRLAAHALREEGLGKGLQITVFEWGRGPGGRLARKRAKLPDGREVFFDHSAPFFALSDEVLRETGWLEPGGQLMPALCDYRPAREVYSSGVDKSTDQQCRSVRQLTDGDVAEENACAISDSGPRFFVGAPESNNALVKHLAKQLAEQLNEKAHFLYGRHVRAAVRNESSRKWEVRVENRFPAATGAAEENYEFDILVLSDRLALAPGEYKVVDVVGAPGIVGSPSVSASGAGAQVVVQDHDELETLQRIAGSASPEGAGSCIVLMVAARRTSQAMQDVYRCDDHRDIDGGRDHPSVLSMIVREGSKPMRVPDEFQSEGTKEDGIRGALEAAPAESFVELFTAYSTREFAKQHVVFDRDANQGAFASGDVEATALRDMLAVFRQRTGLDETDLLQSSLFLWDHAQPTAASLVPALGAKGKEDSSSSARTSFYSAGARLGVCGDFFGEGRSNFDDRWLGGVDTAVRSGLDLADALGEVLVQNGGLPSQL